MELELKEITDKILMAAVNVHKEPGAGFLESVYENAMKIELGKLNVPFQNQVEEVMYYSGTEVGRHKIDLIVDNKVVVELKAVSDFGAFHLSQIKSYLRATGLKVGFLINFAKEKMDAKRFVL